MLTVSGVKAYCAESQPQALRAFLAAYTTLPDESLSDTEETQEMGWEWWEAMQNLVLATVGEDRCRHTLACEAWSSVYLPITCEPHELVIPMEGAPFKRSIGLRTGPGIRERIVADILKSEQAEERKSFLGGFLKKLRGDAPKPDDPTGKAPNESYVYQVGSLPSLCEELSASAIALGIPTDEEGLRAFLESYQTEERFESDPDRQCLAVTLEAAKKAIARKEPLWVVK